jgi:hypothetical protein
MSAEDFQAKAELAKRHAGVARSEQERQAYLEIAHLWRSLAERAPPAPPEHLGRSAR